MDWLAELWVRSGRSTRRLYKGSTEGIVTALKAWVERRKAHNDTDMAAHWKMLQTLDSLHQIGDLSGRIRQDKAAEMMEQIAKITAAQVEQLDCNRNLNKEKDRETALADFLLASLQYHGFRWPEMPYIEGRKADASVCAFLGLLDQGFNAEMELEILEDRHRVTHWRKELRMRDNAHAYEVAKDPIPGVNTHPIGLVGARFRQAIANDSAISTMQALADAADGILDPDILGSLLDRNPASTTSTRPRNNTGGTAHAMDKSYRTPNSTAVYKPDVLGDIDTTARKSKTTTKDSIVYIADTLGNVTTSLLTNNAVDPADNLDNAAVSSSRTPDNTNSTAELTSNYAADTSTNDQDDFGQMSKAKKKREGRKRAKIQANEAVAKTGDSIGGHDDDHKDAQALVDS